MTRTVVAILLLAGLAACESVEVKEMTMEELPPVNSYWDYSDPAASEAAFREAVANAEASGNDAYAAEAMTQLTRSLGMQRNFEAAQSVLDELAPKLMDEMTVPGIRFELEQGRVLNSSGNPTASLAHFQRALELADAAGEEFYAVDAAHMLGIAAEPEDAIRWNERAMKMAESASDERARGWLGPLYNNLAWTYSDLGDHEKALGIFEKDIQFRESRGLDFEASIARWSAAKMMRFLGRVDEALVIQQELATHPLRQGKPAEGYSHEEIGECLLQLGREDEAKPHFAIAYERLHEDQWLQANEADRLARLKSLGGL